MTTAICPHAASWAANASALETLKASLSHDRLYDECAHCYISTTSENGLNICLSCMYGYCKENNHEAVHVSKEPNHCIYVNLKRRVLPKEEASAENGQVVIKQEDEYEVDLTLGCWSCRSFAMKQFDLFESDVHKILSSIKCLYALPLKAHLGAGNSVDALQGCRHCDSLVPAPEHAHSDAEEQCNHVDCDQKANLWKCLACGWIGCGRKQADGTGGNGHASEHYASSKHPVTVKLGTLSPVSHPDVYCYECDELRIDAKLREHLAAHAIDLSSRRKTELNMAELEIEKSKKIDYSLTKEEGLEEFKTINDAQEWIGLKNLGNSCYFASIMQLALRIPFLKGQMDTLAVDHSPVHCNRSNPYNCFTCQLVKFSSGLGGRQRLPVIPLDSSPRPTIEQQCSLLPAWFRRALAGTHPEFGSHRQQDAFEFWQYVIKELVAKQVLTPIQLGTLFDFELVQQLTCSACSASSYSLEKCSALSLPLPAYNKALNERLSLEKCLDAYFASPEIVEYKCSSCHASQSGSKYAFMEGHVSFHNYSARRMYVRTLPRCLVVHLQRFTYDETWSPVKLNVPVDMPANNVTLLPYLLPATINLEAELTKARVPSKKAQEPLSESDQNLLDQLTMLGFERKSCQVALRKGCISGPKTVDALVSWLLEHPEAATADDAEAESQSTAADEAEADTDTLEQREEALAIILSMGFTKKQATRALKETQYNTERAMDWLLSHPMDESADAEATRKEPSQHSASSAPPASGSFSLHGGVVHKGPSTQCGHYLALLCHGKSFVMLNDEKISLWTDKHSTPPLLAHGYLYFYHHSA